MEMQQIRYFLALSQTLNFTRAAEDCNITQPALTRAIQALEAELGGELIRRERGKSHLTELGRRMLPLLQQCYEAANSAKSLAKAVQSSDVAPLSLAVSHSVNVAVFISPVTELFRAYPGLQLRIRRGTADEILSMLKQGDVEVALAGSLGEAWERLDSWPIFRDEIRLVVSADHPLGRRNEEHIGLETLVGERLLSRIDWESEDEIVAALRAKGYEPEAAHEVETDHDLIALLEANAGVGFVPVSAPRSARVRRLKLKGLDLERTVAVYAVAGRLRSPVATALVNLLRATDWSTLELTRPS
ncbi:MAG: LysR family transcriptional regulator [Alphaproteobacteria bacterium]|nr:LysR family transcriptional regulator [Alphaproteobacteria bacterium]